MSKYTIENRNSLFFGKYQYRSSFTLVGAYYANRNNTVEAMKEYIKERDQDFQEFGKKWGRHNLLLSDYINVYSKFIRWREKNKEKIMVRTHGDDVSIFTNDVKVIESLSKLDTEITPTTTEVNLECEPNVLLRKDPKHNYRVYLKSRRIKDEFHKELADFFNQRKQSIFPCRSLLAWANKHSSQKWYLNWSQSSHFMEFDDESMITLVKLFFGDIIGKSYKIEKRPES